jgi:hypothetical protein
MRLRYGTDVEQAVSSITGEAADMGAGASHFWKVQIRDCYEYSRLHLLYAEKMNKTERSVRKGEHILCSSLVARLDQLASTEGGVALEGI